MELFLFYLVAFMRPIFFIDIGATNLFDVGGIGIIVALCFALLMRGAVGKTLRLGLADVLIATFVIWCASIALIYPDTLEIRGLAKLATPLLGYTVAKNLLLDRAQYMRMLLLLILGYVVPIVLSAVLIMLGKGVEGTSANYWTGILRWEGVYDGAHNMGHNMTFLVMLVTIYATLRYSDVIGIRRPLRRPAMLALAALSIVAVYCLWMSQVRTALFGLIIFVGVYLYYRNKRLLFFAVAAGSLSIAAMFPVLKPYLFPDVVMVERTGADEGELASGRPNIWKNNLTLFASLPLDRQLAGAGIGQNRLIGFRDSHNDILDLMVQVGIIGLGIFVALQIVILLKILKLAGPEKYLYLAVFLAVLVMNFWSNSYVARFGLAQMYYLILAYPEIRASHREDVYQGKTGSIG